MNRNYASGMSPPVAGALSLMAIMVCVLVALPGCAGDSVENRQTGQMIVCHKGDKTLAVSNASSFVHLDHGDTPGPCPEEEVANEKGGGRDD